MICGNGTTFAVGIPILASNGLFSLGGRMMIVLGRVTAAFFPSQLLNFIPHGLALTVRLVTGHPQGVSFRFAPRGEHDG